MSFNVFLQHTAFEDFFKIIMYNIDTFKRYYNHLMNQVIHATYIHSKNYEILFSNIHYQTHNTH